MNSIPVKHVTICGFGLIGGCIALDLLHGRNRPVVTAFDRPAVLKRLAADKRFPVRVEQSFVRAVGQADLVILAAPHVANETMLSRLSRMRTLHNCLVIDTGAVKKPVAALAKGLVFSNGVEFVPTHPMAGREKAGFENADRILFRDRAWFLCDDFEVSQIATARLTWLIKRLGATPVNISSALHDQIVAEISHLPQLLSTLLGAQVDPAMIQLSGPGLKSMLRLAGSPYAVWNEIIDQNRNEIVNILHLFRGNLDTLIAAVEKGESIRQIFQSASRSYRCLS